MRRGEFQQGGRVLMQIGVPLRARHCAWHFMSILSPLLRDGELRLAKGHVGRKLQSQVLTLIPKLRLIWLHQGARSGGPGPGGGSGEREEGMHALIIIEARSGELGNWSETKRARKEEDSKWHWSLGHEDGDAIGVNAEGCFESNDEELGFRASELEA